MGPEHDGFDALCEQQGHGADDRDFLVGRFVFLVLPSWDVSGGEQGTRTLNLFKAWPLAVELSLERCAALCDQHPTCDVAAFDMSTG